MREETQTYDDKYFEPLQAIEAKHFWFRSRNRLITSLLRTYIPGLQRKRITGMEIGCGTGNVLQHLRKEFPDSLVVGMDLYRKGLQIAAQRGNPWLLQADISASPFPALFDWIGLFDILEHLPEDAAVLQATAALLKPQGKIFLTVPAFPLLWSYFDVAGKHQRRYTVQSLRSVCEEAGLEIQFASYTHAMMFPLMYLLRRVFQMGAAPESLSAAEVDAKTQSELRIVPGINGLMTLILGVEAKLISWGIPMPFGTSLIAVLQVKR